MKEKNWRVSFFIIKKNYRKNILKVSFLALLLRIVERQSLEKFKSGIELKRSSIAARERNDPARDIAAVTKLNRANRQENDDSSNVIFKLLSSRDKCARTRDAKCAKHNSSRNFIIGDWRDIIAVNHRRSFTLDDEKSYGIINTRHNMRDARSAPFSGKKRYSLRSLNLARLLFKNDFNEI